MLDIKNFERAPLAKLKKLKVGDKIELLTFKRDRKVVIIKMAEHSVNVLQDGFEIKEYIDLSEPELMKLLHQLRKIEFPRSHKFFMEIIPANR